MHVELITSAAHTGTTGLSRYSSELYKELKKSEVDVGITQPQLPMAGMLRTIGQIVHLDPITFFSNYPISTKKLRADIIHLPAENLSSLLMFKRLQPVVVTVHAFFTYFLRKDHEHAIYNNWMHRVFDHLAARGLHRADAIIAVSHYVASLLKNELKIPSERIHVIYEGIDPAFFRPIDVPNIFRKKHRIYSHNFNYLYVGSEQPRKNFLLLLRAFARIRAKYQQVRLIKIGAPELPVEREKAKKLIRELGIEGDVIFIGHVGNELPLFYNVCDVFVFPSLYEGFGFPPLEAMACGIPVLCSNSTSLPEVVGDAAITFSPNDEDTLVMQMEKLLLNKELKNMFRQRGLKRSAKFSWQETTRQTIDVYKTLTL
jgi:glycosyltransferase involved in cell wall biosynthesis